MGSGNSKIENDLGKCKTDQDLAFRLKEECERRAEREETEMKHCNDEMKTSRQRNEFYENIDFNYFGPPKTETSSFATEGKYKNMFDSWKQNMNICDIVKFIIAGAADKPDQEKRTINELGRSKAKNFISLISDSEGFFLVVKYNDILYSFEPSGSARNIMALDILKPKKIEMTEWIELKEGNAMFRTFIFCLYVAHNLCLNSPDKAVHIMEVLSKVDRNSYTRRYLTKLTAMVNGEVGDKMS